MRCKLSCQNKVLSRELQCPLPVYSSRHGLDGVSEFDLTSSLHEAFLAEGRADLLSLTGNLRA